jgi:hypothetical protein
LEGQGGGEAQGVTDLKNNLDSVAKKLRTCKAGRRTGGDCPDMVCLTRMSLAMFNFLMVAGVPALDSSVDWVLEGSRRRPNIIKSTFVITNSFHYYINFCYM